MLNMKEELKPLCTCSSANDAGSFYKTAKKNNLLTERRKMTNRESQNLEFPV